MRPSPIAQQILSTTRATAKLHEFRVPREDFFELPRDPSALFTLAIGILGDVAAKIADEGHADIDLAALMSVPLPDTWREGDPTSVEGLRFVSTFFDAFLNARLNETITVEFSLLCATAYYLSGNAGSASVIVRHMEQPSLQLCGGLARLLHSILKNDFEQFDAPHLHQRHTAEVLQALGGYMNFENEASLIFNACSSLRRRSYVNGSPRELLFSDLVGAVCTRKRRNAARALLPIASDLPEESWRPALAKMHFPVELWPSQQLIARAGLFRGASALIQMPTSAGKTRATELIIRSAFLSRRASLAVIVAPFRSLCHDIRSDLSTAFSGEPIILDEVSDSYQFDIHLEQILETTTILIVTPEKLLYMLRRAPELTRRIGLVIYDEGHQFDSLARGPTYELLLTSLRMTLGKNTQTVLISAVIGNADVIADWLIGDPGAVVSGSDLLPTSKSIAFASWQTMRGKLEYVSPTNPDDSEFFVPRIINDIVLPAKPRETKQRRFPEKDGGDVGLFLGLHIVANGSVAVFCGRKDSAAKLCRRLVEIFERGVPYGRPIAVSDEREVEKIRLLAEAHLGAGASATRAAALGVFAHHADTPPGLRLSIEHAMKEGLAKFVICTSTLAQGVNFPLKYLIVTSTRQGAEKILVRDFHNLMGRAGRAGMHTEGSIIFSTPSVFDQRRSFAHRQRWQDTKNLLDVSKSEPCKSSLLSIFGDYVQRRAGAPPVVQAVRTEWLDLAFADRARIDAIVAIAVDIQPNISAAEFRKSIESRARVVQSIAAFLISNIDFEKKEEVPERIAQLATNTLAYNLGDADQRVRLIELFLAIGSSIGERTDAEQRIVIQKSPLPPRVVAELQDWIVGNLADLLSAADHGRLLEVVAPVALAHTSAPSIRNLSDSKVLTLALEEWVAGRSYTAVHDLLLRRNVRVSGDKATVEDAVALCENGFGYDAAMVVASIADLVEPISEPLHAHVSLLQRQIKHGLSDPAALAFLEAGFSDRVVATALAQAWSTVSHRREVREVCRNNRDAVVAILESMPSYFKVVAAEYAM